MKFGMGIPAWLGAILVIGPPAAVAGLVAGLLQNFIPPWAQPFIGFISFLLAGGVWVVAIMWWENRAE